jgi:single-strand DNA-binding protein
VIAAPTKRRSSTRETEIMSNATILSGNLTRDPEIRYTREGQANATFGLAVNRRWQPRGSDEWEEATSFFDVVCWRELAENVALSLVKGSRVIVSGRLEQHVWESDSGERRSKVEVTADEVGPSLRFATAEISRNERRSDTRGLAASDDGRDEAALGVDA